MTLPPHKSNYEILHAFSCVIANTGLVISAFGSFVLTPILLTELAIYTQLININAEVLEFPKDSGAKILVSGIACTYLGFTGAYISQKLLERGSCTKCRNYHGKIYRDSYFCCAMHPYGKEKDPCPDFEKTE